MSFRLSAKRVSVLAKLRKVNLMVLTEQGVGIQEETDNQFSTVKEIINDRFSWQAVFSRLCLKIKVFDNSIGSKTNLKAYGENIKKFCVAIEFDFEKVNEEKTDSIFVLYTYRHIGENDVFTKVLLLEHLKDLLLDYVERRKVVQEVDKLVLEFLRSLRIIMFYEFNFRKFRVNFVTRLNSDRFVNLDKKV